jgi:hypothetical protein
MAGLAGGPLGIIGAAISAIGTLASGAASQRQAEAQAAALDYQAKVEEKRAMEERALAQRKAMDRRREGKLALSTLQARAAASGGSATDPSIINVGSNIAGRTELGALQIMSEGENSARHREDQAAINRWRANNTREQAGMEMFYSFFRAGTSLLAAASSTTRRGEGPAEMPKARSTILSGASAGLHFAQPFAPRNDYWQRLYS